MKNKTKKPNGVYVVTESGCLEPHSGAYFHISVGLKELSKYFSINAMLPEVSKKNITTTYLKNKSNTYPLKIRQNYFVGGFRDLKLLTTSIFRAFCLANKIYKEKLDFVYVRNYFLDPLPIFLCLLRIPCFIEANGLQFEGRKKYYPSSLTPFNKFYERLIYSSASHVFFVGSYGKYWKLNSHKWSNVENGVTYEFVAQFVGHKKEVKCKINLAFVGRLMAHHQPELLIEAIKNLDSEKKSKVCFHLIGSGLDLFKQQLQNHIEVIEHGFLNRNELTTCLKKIHVGLIPGLPKYQSQMKLFDYGAAKCIVVAPRVFNLEYWFDNSEIEFFKAGNSQDLAKVLTSLIKNLFASTHHFEKGEKLHRKVLNNFTWEKIFEEKAELIKSKLAIKNNI